MRLHRFIQKNIDLDGPLVLITDPELIHQITSVLRLNVGDRLIVSDGIQTAAETEITGVEKEKIITNIIKKEQSTENKNGVQLYVSIPKKDILERIVQMTTELGVQKIVPIICERTVKTGVVLPRLEKIAKEATELSGRFRIPRIESPITFSEALTQAKKDTFKIIILDKNGERLKKREEESCALFIGPEGGFTEKEISLAKECGAHILSLGDYTLRVETAAVASMSIAL